MSNKVSLPGKTPVGLSDGPPSALIALATLLLLLCGPLLSGDLSADLSRVASTGAGARAAQDGSEQKGKKKKSKKSGKTKKSTLSPEASLVKKHLEDYLHPSSIKYLKGGRVKLQFAFRRKSEDQERIFLPSIGAGIKAPFRWSQEGEDRFVGSEPGIRISDRGFTLLDCWFLDDVEAKIEVLQHINYSPRMYVAITFHNEKGRGLGSNYGSQCALFSRGRLAKRGGGKVSGISFNVKAKLALVIKDGFAEARKGSSTRPNDRMKYSQKTYAAGRVGFAWGGSMSATVTSLEVTGKLDIPRMAKLLKKKLRL